MRTDPRDPHTRWEVESAKFSAARDAYIAGQMTEPVFEASLYALGYRGEALRVEVRLARMDKYERTARP